MVVGHYYFETLSSENRFQTLYFEIRMIALGLLSVNSQKLVARILTGNREIILLFCGNLKNHKIRTAYSLVR